MSLRLLQELAGLRPSSDQRAIKKLIAQDRRRSKRIAEIKRMCDLADERLKAGVPICCLTRYQSIIKNQLLKAHGIYYYVPDLLNHFDTEAVIALIAPRPVLFLDGDEDGTSPVDGIHEIENAVRPVYRLYGKEDSFQSIVYPGQGHLYTPEMWARTLKWLDEKLKLERRKG